MKWKNSKLYPAPSAHGEASIVRGCARSRRLRPRRARALGMEREVRPCSATGASLPRRVLVLRAVRISTQTGACQHLPRAPAWPRPRDERHCPSTRTAPVKIRTGVTPTDVAARRDADSACRRTKDRIGVPSGQRCDPSTSVLITARPGRFELPTPGSVDRCSIQLSYGRPEGGDT
jgi:hypothetical protein